MGDEFLSKEDLDLKDVPEDELFAWWDLWLEMAQATNERDEHTWSHGVFMGEHPPGPGASSGS